MSESPVTVSAPKSTMAVTALVLGAVSFLGCSLLVAVPAIIVGVMARSRIRRYPEQYAGKGMATTGLILGIANIVLCVVIAGLIALMLPGLRVGRSAARAVGAQANIKSISAALLQYNVEFGANPEQLAQLTENHYLDNGKVLTDPAVERKDTRCDFIYTGMGLNPNRIELPDQFMMLYGPAVHRGNARAVGFADGHSAMAKPSEFADLLAEVNRIRAVHGLRILQADQP